MESALTLLFPCVIPLSSFCNFRKKTVGGRVEYLTHIFDFFSFSQNAAYQICESEILVSMNRTELTKTSG